MSLLSLLLWVGCSSGSPEGLSDADRRTPSLVEAPLGPLPERLTGTGYLLEPLTGDWSSAVVVDRAVAYAPAHPLWTNGSGKTRHLLMPEGERIDNSDPARWRVPTGTLVFKTFTYLTADGEQPVETRLIRRLADDWDYAVYVWDGDDAYLREEGDARAVSVVPLESEPFAHQVPSAIDCRSCHETAESTLIGLGAEQLAEPLGDAERSQLAQWRASGLLVFETEVGETPSDDDEDGWVASYLHGNCAHCHWPGGVPTSLDLRREHAIASIVDQPTMAISFPSGLRVASGAPEDSLLLTALAAERPASVRPMPPLGVQRVDAEAVARLSDWIAALPSETTR